MNDPVSRFVRWLRNAPELPDTEPRIDLERIVANDPTLQQLEQAHTRIRDLSDRMGRIGASGVSSADLIRGRYVPRRTTRPHAKGAP